MGFLLSVRWQAMWLTIALNAFENRDRLELEFVEAGSSQALGELHFGLEFYSEIMPHDDDVYNLQFFLLR